MTLFVEADKISGCIYIDWLGSIATADKLREIEEALRAVSLSVEQREGKAMLIVGPGLQTFIGALAIERSSILDELDYFDGLALELPDYTGPKSLVIDDGGHVAFKAGSHIPVGMLIKDSGSPNQNHKELLEAAWKEWNHNWDKMLQETNG